MTTLQNLFVAKLPRNLTDTDLQKIFDEYHPVSAKIMLDATTGKSKGFGFVLFDSEEAGRVAYEKLNKTHVTLQGHSFNLCIFPSKHDGKIANEPSNALYVRNIPRTLAQSDVEDFLRTFGPLKYCAMREDHYGGNVWVVYTEFESVDCAKEALEQLHGNKSHFPDQVILAKFADSEEAKRERRRRRELHGRDDPLGRDEHSGGGPSGYQGRRSPNTHGNNHNNGNRGDQSHDDLNAGQGSADLSDPSSLQSNPSYGSGPGFGYGNAPPPPPPPPASAGLSMPRNFSGHFPTADAVAAAAAASSGANPNGAYGQPPPPAMGYHGGPPPPAGQPGGPNASNNNNNLGVNYGAAPAGSTPLSQSFLNVTFNASGNHFPSNDRTTPGTPLNFSFGPDGESGLAASESGSYAGGAAIPSALSPTNFQPNTPVRRASNLSSSGTYRHNPYAPVTPVSSNPGSGRVSPRLPDTPLQGTATVVQVNPSAPVHQHFATSNHPQSNVGVTAGGWTSSPTTGFSGNAHFSSSSAQAYRAPPQAGGPGPAPPPSPPEQA